MDKIAPEDEVTPSLDLNDLWKNPNPLSFDEKGMLSFSDFKTYSEKTKLIKNVLPRPEDFVWTLQPADKQLEREKYIVGVCCLVFPDFQVVIDKNNRDLDYWKDKRSVLSQFGSDVDMVIGCLGNLWYLTETAKSSWEKYQLSPEEVSEVDLVAGKRREISVRRANFETSSDFMRMKKIDRLKEEEKFDAEFESVTSTLYKILHMGQNYLSSRERIKHFIDAEKQKKTRSVYLEEILIKVRLKYLKEYREFKERFRMPDPFS